MHRYIPDLFWGASIAVFMTAAGLVGCQSSLIDGLSEEQANQVLVALNSGAIAAKKIAHARPDGDLSYRVEVGSDDLARALSLMRIAEVPARPTQGFKETFGTPGLLPTATEERARYAAALSGELERSIESIEGVVDARVHIALPESRTALLDSPPPKGRASVMIKQKRGAVPVDETAIRALVAGAATELEPAAVAVVKLVAPAQTSAVPDLVRVGPVTVTRSSASTLKMIASGVLLLDIALAVALMALFAKLRRLSSQAPIMGGITAQRPSDPSQSP
jgi:type III secretion protein J